MKLKKVIDITRRIPAHYLPPNCHCFIGYLLESIYDTNWYQEMKYLPLDEKIFDVTLFGDWATIKTFPMVNFIGAGVQNKLSMLDVFDC